MTQSCSLVSDMNARAKSYHICAEITVSFRVPLASLQKHIRIWLTYGLLRRVLQIPYYYKNYIVNLVTRILFKDINCTRLYYILQWNYKKSKIPRLNTARKCYPLIRWSQQNRTIFSEKTNHWKHFFSLDGKYLPKNNT